MAGSRSVAQAVEKRDAREGIVYEVELGVPAAQGAALDEWLGEHVAEMLSLPGFTGAEIFEVDADDPGETRRSVRYSLVDRAALERYLEEHAPRMRAAGPARFGDALSSSRRVLSPPGAAPAGAAGPRCRNCDALLTGQYCWSCGQRARSRLISLWALIREALGDLLELDSRFWRTMIVMVAKPGRLTSDYLAGRQARYMPPFRMYLVLSLVFFLVAFFDSDDFLFSLSPIAEPDPAAMPDADGTAAAADAPDDGGDTVADAAPGAAANAGPGRLSEDELEAAAETALESALRAERQVASAVRASEETGAPGPIEAPPEPAVVPPDEDTCDSIELGSGPLARHVDQRRLRERCRRIVEDGGEGVGEALINALPTAMFVFLPVLALVLKLLYPLSRRYYVEHLLFMLHFHAFAFLALTVEILLARVFGDIAVLTGIAVGIYLPVYLYKAMRRVYGQGRFATVVKFVTLCFAYIIALALMLAVTALIAVISA